MRTKTISKLIHEGELAAEVNVELIYTDDDWSPFLSLNDAQKLDNVREALRKKDLQTATLYARVFTLKPIVITHSSEKF